MPTPPSRRALVQDALISADAMAARVRTLLARAPGPVPERQAVADEVLRLLQQAIDAASGVQPPFRPVLNWWRASALDAAYGYLHAAHTQMVELYGDTELDTALPAALATVRREFDLRDPRRLNAERIAQLKPTESRRSALRACLEAAFASSDNWHRRQRSFRNIVILATLGITALVIAVVLVVFRFPDYMPFCFENLQTAEGAATPAQAAVAPPAEVVAAVRVTSCPTGRPVDTDHPASSYDIVMVALMGLLGGSLAAAVSIRKVHGSDTPYDIPVWLATIKVPTGALTAIAGIIAIRGDFVPGLSGLDSQEQILAYSLVLGYAQQLATGLLDRRAESLAQEPPTTAITAPTPAAHPAGEPAAEPPKVAKPPERRRRLRPGRSST